MYTMELILNSINLACFFNKNSYAPKIFKATLYFQSGIHCSSVQLTLFEDTYELMLF